MSDHAQNFQTAWHVAEVVYSLCYDISICLYRCRFEYAAEFFLKV